MKTRVLIADDHETVREGLRLLLDAQPDIEVVGQAADGRQALDEIRRLHPQVVVMDISMPGVNGLAATRAAKTVAPDVAVIALSRHTDEAYVQDLLGAGASGYVLKQSASTELLQAIRAAAAGERYLDSTLVARHANAYLSRHTNRPPGATISERESNVLRMMAVGHSNKEIGSALEISVKTVEVHKANAMRKLGLRGRIDVVRYAVLNGWLQDP
jgi:two-component system, NarL family, response regulator NreC